MREWTHCPVCNSTEQREVYRFEPAKWIPGKVVDCLHCRVLYKIPSDTAKPLADYYDESYAQIGLHESPEAANRAMQTICDSIVQAVGGANRTLLDIGCGRGVFLSIAKKAGFTVSGLDLNPVLAESARKTTGAEVFVGDLMNADFGDKRFDVITMLDLIEHLQDPIASLRRCRDLLSPGGSLVVYTPNHKGLIVRIADIAYRMTGGRVSGPVVEIFDCTHVTFYDVPTLRKSMESAGLKVDKTSLIKYDTERTEQAKGLMAAGVRGIEAVSPLVRGQFRILMYGRN